MNTENKVLNFMDKVKQQRDMEKQEADFRNSTNYKLKCLDRCQADAKGVCLDALFSKLYKDALPLHDDYKVAYGDDLDAEFRDFINDRCPKGMEYYVRDAACKGSKCAIKLLEKVESLVNEKYRDKAMHIENCDPEDLVFKMDDDGQNKIDVIYVNLGLSDVSKAIRDNVKSTAVSEIMRAKKAKDEAREFEKELAADITVTSESVIEHKMNLKGMKDTRTFQPSLFQGIMIGKVNEFMESEVPNLYGAVNAYRNLDDETDVTTESSNEEYAFVESIKEFTKLNIIKALKFEKFSLNDIRSMASEYAYNK